MAAAPFKELYVAPFHRLEALLGGLLRRMEGGDPFRARRVLVISNLVRDRLQERLAREGAWAGVDFLTPLDLAREIAGPRVRRAGLRPLPPGGDAALASRLLRENAGRLRRLRPPEGIPGYDEALAATLADLREAGVSPADLQRAGDDSLRDLALLLDAYEARLASLGFHDEPGLLRAACGEAEASPQDIPTLLYGFADLNALQRRLVEACCRSAPAAALVPAEEGAPACAFVRPMLAWLRALGFADRKVEKDGERPFAEAGRALFSAEGGASLAGDALRIVSAPAPGREAFELVRELLYSPGGSREAAVLVPGGEGYASLFEETCRSLGVEARAERGVSLVRTPAGRALLGMLLLRERGYPRAEVLRFLDEGSFAASASFLEWRTAKGSGEEDSCLASRWEVLSRRLPYANGEDGWRRAIDRAKKEEASASIGARRASPLRTFEAALNILFTHLRALPARALPSVHAEAAKRAFEALTGEIEGKEGVLAALEGAGRLDPFLGEVEGAEFRRWAALALERPGGGEPPKAARVRILSLQGARGLSFGTVAIPGLAEGLFPAHGREDPLLADDLRRRLNGRLAPEEKGLPPRLALKGERMAEARYLFWLALQSAGRRVVLGVPRAGGDGERSERASSLFLHHLASALGIAGEDEGLPRFGADVLRIAAPGLEKETLRRRPVSALEGDLAALAALLPPARAERGALAHLGAAPGFARRWLALDDRWRPNVLTVHDGMLEDPDLLERLRGPLHPSRAAVAVTRLERFFQCPYQFLLGSLPGLDAAEAPGPPLDADGLLRGGLFHAALERFFRSLKDRGAGPGEMAEEEFHGAVSAAAAGAFGEAEEAGSALLPLPWRLLRASVERQLEGFLRSAYRSGPPAWRPVEVEGKFKDLALALPPEAGDGRLLVSGRYDLLERSAKGEYRFVDFKSGRTAPKKKDPLGGGLWLQPHLYVRRGEGMLEPGARIGAAYAFVAGGAGYRLSGLSPEEMARLRPQVDRLLALFLRSAEAGVFFPLPSAACGHCSFVSICGPERGPRARRKAEAAGRQALRMAQGPNAPDGPEGEA